jgi:hypothetical protein
LFPPDDERLSLETCRGREINTLKKVKKVLQVGCNIQDLMIISINLPVAESGSLSQLSFSA